jgi:hypothetical protein
VELKRGRKIIEEGEKFTYVSCNTIIIQVFKIPRKKKGFAFKGSILVLV